MLLKTLQYVGFDNDFDTDERAWNPEVWAAETLMILEANMVAAGLVYKDFSMEIASFGDTVNTRIPAKFTAKRKGTNDDVTVQPAVATKVPVVLNQHWHTSFLIRDGEESRSFKNLVDEYLDPAALSLAEQIDRVLLGQVYQFRTNQSQLDPNGSGTMKDAMLDVRNLENRNLAPVSGRNLILTTVSETEALSLDLFISADKVGDDGTAMREASLGKKLGYETFMCQHQPSILTAAGTTGTSGGAGSTDGAVVAGTSVLTMSTDSSAILPGMYVTFDNCGGFYRVTASGATSLTLDQGILQDLPDDSIATWYTADTVDLAGDTGVTAYGTGWDKAINLDGGVTPVVGQLVSFSTAADVLRTGEYAIVEVEDGVGPGDIKITLDRPLEEGIVDGDNVNYGPSGEFNFAFDQMAMALVMRPLAQPMSGAGALSGVSSYNNLSMRVVITYQGLGQGHLVTVDMLAGVKVLDVDRGAMMIRP